MRRRLLRGGEDDDPMSDVSNLFDVAMVFVVVFLLDWMIRCNMTDMIS